MFLNGSYRLIAVALVFFATIFTGMSEAWANIGLAKQATATGRSVVIELYVANLHPTDTLSSIQITDNLDKVFGAGNYSITEAPILDVGPATLTLNSGFDGSTDTDVTTGGSLDSGQSVQIHFSVQLNTISDQGLGLGLYSNQAMVDAEGPTMTLYSDLSDSGTDPDPNNNGDPSDAGEDDPTFVDVLSNPELGIAKRAVLNGTQVTFDLFLDNLGNRDLGMVSVIDDLDSVFGAGNYTIINGPSLIDDPGTLVLNMGFDGSSDTELVATRNFHTGEQFVDESMDDR